MADRVGVVGRVVVVGGSVGGLRAAEAVRKTGYAGEVLVVGAERHMPYNRPPLSKEALATGPDVAGLTFRVPRAARDVQFRLGEPVVSADLEARTVTLAGGEVLGWEGLVVATGLAARRLALPGPRGGRHVLRTVEDALELRASMPAGSKVVVIGAGFVGCEVAATARGLGCEVDVVAPESAPMERPLGHDLGTALRRRHEAAGVRFHLGNVPTQLVGEDRVTSVLLTDGSRLDADVVLEAVGSSPNVEWLHGSGLDLRDGLLCVSQMRVEGRADVVACGDVARFPNLLFDAVPRRVEHWTMAIDTAKKAGHTLGAYLVGAALDVEPFRPVPSFWSDQYDLRIQSFGAVWLGGDDIRVLEGRLGSGVAVGYHRHGVLVGVVLVGMTGSYLAYRDLIAQAAATAPAVAGGSVGSSR